MSGDRRRAFWLGFERLFAPQVPAARLGAFDLVKEGGEVAQFTSHFRDSKVLRT